MSAVRMNTLPVWCSTRASPIPDMTTRLISTNNNVDDCPIRSCHSRMFWQLGRQCCKVDLTAAAQRVECLGPSEYCEKAWTVMDQHKLKMPGVSKS